MIPPPNWREQVILEQAITEQLRFDLAAMERRAALAEADWNRLLAEVVTVRRALDDVIHGVICSGSGPIAPCFDADDYAVERVRGQWSAVDGKAIQRVRDALTATPTAAALGTLCEAALTRRRARLAVGDVRHPETHPREYAEVLRAMVDAEKAEDAAADAVLADRGKEGASDEAK